MENIIAKLSSYKPMISQTHITTIHRNPKALITRMNQSDTQADFPETPQTKPHTSKQLPITPNYPDFGPVPPEEFPKSNRENSGPNFPVPPKKNQQVPDAPKPPMPSPTGSGILPSPNGSEIPPSPTVSEISPPSVFPPNDPDAIPMGLLAVEPPRRLPKFSQKQIRNDCVRF
uniref:Uncharacterized protein n=1 Tax=Daucus carota subsp. sativus TaxID=79200 RepID=A0A166H5V1_DAUCS